MTEIKMIHRKIILLPKYVGKIITECYSCPYYNGEYGDCNENVGGRGNSLGRININNEACQLPILMEENI